MNWGLLTQIAWPAIAVLLGAILVLEILRPPKERKPLPEPSSVRTEDDIRETLRLCGLNRTETFLFMFKKSSDPESSNIDTTLRDFAVFLIESSGLKRRIEQRNNRFVAAIVIGLIPAIVFSLYATPVYEETLVGYEAALPGPLLFTLAASHFLQCYIIHTLVLAIITVRAFRVLLGGGLGRKIARSLFSFVPFTGSLLRKIETSQLLGTLAVLLRSGVPETVALEVAGGEVHSPVIRREINNALAGMEQGRTILEVLIQAGLMSGEAAAHGDEDHTDRALMKEIESLHAQVAESEERLPAKIWKTAAISAVVTTGFMFVSMYLPVFSMGPVISGD
jgi:type II secretory pathway component PulF